MTTEATDSGAVHDDSDLNDTFAYVRVEPDPEDQTIEVPLSRFQARQMLPPGVFDELLRTAGAVDNEVFDTIARAALTQVEPVSLATEAQMPLTLMAGDQMPLGPGFSGRYLPEIPTWIEPEMFSGLHDAVVQHLPTQGISTTSLFGDLPKLDLWPGFRSLDLLGASLTFDVWPDLPTINLFGNLANLDLSPDLRSLDLLGDHRFQISSTIGQVTDLLSSWRSLLWRGHPKAGRAMRAALRARRAVLLGNTKAVGRFAVMWLGFAKALDWVIDAVSAALLDDDWLEESSPRDQLRKLTTDHHRVQKNLFEQTLRRAPIQSFSAPVAGLAEVTVGDTLVAPDVVLGEFDDPRLEQILGNIPPEARAVALAWSDGATWNEAAQLCDMPPGYGETVRTKLKRLGLQFQERQRNAAATRNRI